jgi:hypothetical protein
MKCNKCSYEWNTKSDKLYVSCPNCLQKVKKQHYCKVHKQDVTGCDHYNCKREVQSET